MAVNNPYRGINTVLYIRNLSQATTMSGGRLALQTTHTLSVSADSDSQATKDGNISTPGVPETTLSVENIGSDDFLDDVIKNSVFKGNKLEIWEVNFDKPNPNTPAGTAPTSFFARYMQGQASSWESENAADSTNTHSAEFAINGTPQDGYVTLDKPDLEALQYAFHDITPVEALTLTPTTASLKVGATTKLTASREVNYMVKDAKIATIAPDKDGLNVTVTGRKVGTTSVTATGYDGSVVTANITVTAATATPEPKSEAKPEPKSEAKPEPESESKAESKQEAKQEAKQEPKAEAKAEAKPEAKQEAKPEPAPIKLNSFKVDKTEINGKVGEETTVTASDFLPADATDQTLNVFTEDGGVATVTYDHDTTYNVKLLNPGTTKLHFNANDNGGAHAEIAVTVEPAK